MQNNDHKGLCVKCDNVGLLGTIGYSVVNYKIKGLSIGIYNM